MYIFKIKHDFPKLIYFLPLIVIYCLHTCNGQDDFDYRESYLLRSGGDVPASGNFVNSIKFPNTKNKTQHKTFILIILFFSWTISGRFQPTEAPRPPPVTCAPYEATCKDGTCISKVISLNLNCFKCGCYWLSVPRSQYHTDISF